MMIAPDLEPSLANVWNTGRSNDLSGDDREQDLGWTNPMADQEPQ